MRFEDFKSVIRKELRRNRAGLTWAQLKQRLTLPYSVPCPSWTKRLEKEIGLLRKRGDGRAYVWTVRQ